MFLRKDVLKIWSKLTREHPCGSAISIKFQSNFIENRLQYGCSPVNLLHIFRTVFPRNTSGWLLLYISKCFFILAVYIISFSLQFVLAGVFVFEGEIWHFPIRRWRSLAEAPDYYSQSKIFDPCPWSMFQTFCWQKKPLRWKNKHMHTNTHTHTHTDTRILKINWLLPKQQSKGKYKWENGKTNVM